MKTVPAVLEKQYQLIMWLLPRMAEFPKDQRFLLADRIQGTMLDVLERLIEAVYRKDKLPLLREANLGLEKTRFLMRMAMERKYISLKRHVFFCQSADNINYRDLLIITDVSDGVISFPYQIFSFIGVKDNRVIYDVTSLQGKILANVHVTVKDYPEAVSHPCVITDFQNDPRVREFLTITKETAWATYGTHVPGQPEPEPIPYTGEDKNELAPFCSSDAMEK